MNAVLFIINQVALITLPLWSICKVVCYFRASNFHSSWDIPFESQQSEQDERREFSFSLKYGVTDAILHNNEK